MVPSLICGLVLPVLFVATFISAQSSTSSGYTSYSLSLSGDPDSPDVYLNATVHVGEIDLTVLNLTAKVNLGAQVLQVLQFNAGVDASIDRVSLVLANVTAKVLLEARLENLVLVINDTLNALDLNPALATLGQDVGNIVNDTVGALTSGPSQASTLGARSYELANNILYSVNDYNGNTHTNRILTQSGSIIDQFLDNDGDTGNQQVVGSYLSDMTFNGYNQSVVMNDEVVRELEYVYAPFNGLSVVSAIYLNAAGTIVAAHVLSESGGGGSSTVGGP